MNPIHSKNRVIGLLGGSFNPAHAGHVHISLCALKQLQLDEVWWLVSPQNPLKSADNLAAYHKRFDSACSMASVHPKIRVLDIETRHDLRYTCDTIAFMKKRFSGTYFVWLMGADNLAQFHHWQRWKWICEQVPIIIFDRAPFSYSAQRSPAYSKNRKFSRYNSGLNSLRAAPIMRFVRMRRDNISSTSIRKLLKSSWKE